MTYYFYVAAYDLNGNVATGQLSIEESASSVQKKAHDAAMRALRKGSAGSTGTVGLPDGYYYMQRVYGSISLPTITGQNTTPLLLAQFYNEELKLWGTSFSNVDEDIGLFGGEFFPNQLESNVVFYNGGFITFVPTSGSTEIWYMRLTALS